MISSDLRLSTFALVVSLVTNLAIGLGAPYYLRRVKMERPAIGILNARDICVLFVLLGTLPVFYLHLPRWLLLTFLTITFTSALSIGFRSLMSPARVWLAVGALIGLVPRLPARPLDGFPARLRQTRRSGSATCSSTACT